MFVTRLHRICDRHVTVKGGGDDASPPLSMRMPSGRVKKTNVRMLEKSNQNHACDKPPDMSKPRHASAVAGKARASAEELHEKPQSEHERGRDTYEFDKHPDRDEHENGRSRIEKKIGAQHA